LVSVPRPARQTKHVPDDIASPPTSSALAKLEGKASEWISGTADSSAERAGDFNEVDVSKPDELSVQASPLAELPSAALTTPFHPYPEDCLTTEREAASLRLPFMHPRQTSARCAEPSSEHTRPCAPGDLALVSTLFESAKFQQLRRHPASKSGAATNAKKWTRIRVGSRSYRRAPVPEQL
jgi:hypothetical protein